MIARLKPGVPLDQASAELSVIDGRFALQHKFGWDANARLLTVEQSGDDWLEPKIQSNLWLLLASVELVPHIACENIRNLLLEHGRSSSFVQCLLGLAVIGLELGYRPSRGRIWNPCRSAKSRGGLLPSSFTEVEYLN